MGEPTLVLFSGGKDSFLAACRSILEGNPVVLFSCNNGAMSWEEAIANGAERIVNRFGRSWACYAGITGTSSTVLELSEYWASTEQRELGAAYPHLTNCQVTCLHCQCAMWVNAFAFATAKGLKRIITGYRASDVFCTGVVGFLERMQKMGEALGLTVEFPVFDEVWWDEYSLARESEMEAYSFQTWVSEPQCWLGRPPASGKLESMERSDLLRYFDDHLCSVMLEKVPEIARHFAIAKMFIRAHADYVACVPDGQDGSY